MNILISKNDTSKAKRTGLSKIRKKGKQSELVYFKTAMVGNFKFNETGGKCKIKTQDLTIESVLSLHIFEDLLNISHSNKVKMVEIYLKFFNHYLNNIVQI
jgi:hypothetical protein